jgi:hypothetical protein
LLRGKLRLRRNNFFAIWGKSPFPRQAARDRLRLSQSALYKMIRVFEIFDRASGGAIERGGGKIRQSTQLYKGLHHGCLPSSLPGYSSALSPATVLGRAVVSPVVSYEPMDPIPFPAHPFYGIDIHTFHLPWPVRLALGYLGRSSPSCP